MGFNPQIWSAKTINAMERAMKTRKAVIATITDYTKFTEGTQAEAYNGPIIGSSSIATLPVSSNDVNSPSNTVLNLPFDQKQDLRAADRISGAFRAQHAFGRFQAFEQVEVAVGALHVKVRHVLQYRIAHLLATKPVHRGIGQDALKQEGQFSRRAIGVLFCQANHRVRHDIERCVFVAHGVDRSLEGAFLDAFEAIRKFFVAGQW